MDRRRWRIAVLALLVSTWAFGQVLFRAAHLVRHAHAATASPLSHDACALCQIQGEPLTPPASVTAMAAPLTVAAPPERLPACPRCGLVSRPYAEPHLRGPPVLPHV